jgi:hypothetical protein
MHQDSAGKTRGPHPSASLHRLQSGNTGRPAGSGSKLSHQVGGENGFFGGLFQGRNYGRFKLVEDFASWSHLLSPDGENLKTEFRANSPNFREWTKI